MKKRLKITAISALAAAGIITAVRFILKKKKTDRGGHEMGKLCIALMFLSGMLGAVYLVKNIRALGEKIGIVDMGVNSCDRNKNP